MEKDISFMKEEHDREEIASKLRSSFLEFTIFFYPVLTGRQFIISQPVGRESHHITIARALTKASRLEIPNHRLLINVSPGSGKSTMLVMWIAWTMASFPDARFLYISYSKVLATKHTESIKRIMQLSHYEHLFDVRIRHDSKAREYFQTTGGGAVASFGSAGPVVGQDGGLPGLNRFSGAVIIDDAHKPDEVHSDTIRESVIKNYRETIQQRPRGINVPFVFIGQRLHEDDLGAYLIAGKDGYDWHKVILKSIDDAGNALYPEVDPLNKLLKKQETDPYVFSSQYQQDPIPAGGALFKPEWFVMLDEEPNIIYSFITADTAETAKSYNDATAFSFWGIYEIESYGKKTGQYGLHWIDTEECRIEPKDLKDTFLRFWAECMRYKQPPQLVAIEKKSTGGTLLSLIDEIRTVRLMDIPRTKEQGNKTRRFLEVQPYIAERRVSFPSHAKHVKLCIEHMAKITANETHRWDDIADTAADAIRIALIEKTIVSAKVNATNYDDIAKSLTMTQNKINRLKESAYSR
jgi:predicted phage terminase large subunit-like protein